MLKPPLLPLPRLLALPSAPDPLENGDRGRGRRPVGRRGKGPGRSPPTPPGPPRQAGSGRRFAAKRPGMGAFGSPQPPFRVLMPWEGLLPVFPAGPLPVKNR
ncbi:Hypothetical predicted protein [Podarcis lilfordi]|uniref:Uncharacterized protein n=1 Tax=Podarcis lilfordi TaxID=74358 RepID=A0AA35KMR4_9SAUR|nr:Hypothetical predicted protein [Podarcis lilfordi]